MAFIPFEETRAQSAANSPALGPAGSASPTLAAGQQQSSATDKSDQKRGIFRLYAPGKFLKKGLHFQLNFELFLTSW